MSAAWPAWFGAIRHRAALVAIAAIYLVLAVWYTQAAPILEIGDEVWHYQVIDHLAAGRGLIEQGTTPGLGIGHQEGSQPPLYYAAAALLVRAIDPDPAQPRFLWNPWSYAGWIGAGATPNLLLHPESERFPGAGYVRAVHLLRLVSALSGLAALIALHGTVRATLPKRPGIALAAVALVAFNPSFLLVSTTVGNDSPAIALTTLAAWLAFGPAARSGRWPAFAGVGAIAALAGLTKVSGLTVAVPAALIALELARRQGWAIRPLAARLAAIGLPVLALAGWWFVRNLALYGELTGTRRMALIAGVRDQPIRLSDWPVEFAWIGATYWGIRAEALPVWARIAVPAATFGLILLGGWIAVRRARTNPTPLFHAVWAAILLTLLVSWTLLTPASLGRLLFPGVAAFTILLILAPAAWLPRRVFAGVAALAVLGLLAWAILFPSRVIGHEFRDLRRLPDAQRLDRPLSTPAGALPIARRPDHRFGDRIVLEAARLNAGWIPPDEPVGLTLAWRGLAAPDPLVATVYLLCPGNQVVGLARLDLAVGAGERLETPLAIPAATPTEPALCEVTVGVDDPVSGPLPVRNERGEPISAKQPAAEVRLAPLTRPIPPLVTEGAAEFGPGAFRLIGAQPAGPLFQAGSPMTFFLFWEGLAPRDESWTIFVQLIGPDGRLVAQHDGPPAGGGAPTWTWRTGAIVADRRRLDLPPDLPPGEYRVIAGFYRADRPARLPTATGADHAVPLRGTIGR